MAHIKFVKYVLFLPHEQQFTICCTYPRHTNSDHTVFCQPSSTAPVLRCCGREVSRHSLMTSKIRIGGTPKTEGIQYVFMICNWWKDWVSRYDQQNLHGWYSQVIQKPLRYSSMHRFPSSWRWRSKLTFIILRLVDMCSNHQPVGQNKRNMLSLGKIADSDLWLMCCSVS
jgi:hypothetical protein